MNTLLMKHGGYRRFLVGLLSFLLAACGGDSSPGLMSVDSSGSTSFDSAQLANTLATLPLESLNTQEEASLPFMREEEKLAHDVYAVLDGAYASNTRVFANISSSEATHTEAVSLLLVRYGLTDPAQDELPGVFQNADLLSLYTRLVQEGQASLLAGLAVGLAIEELDIRDLQTALVGIDNQDIRLVYDNLMKGSRNHLRSFYKVLLQHGGSYTPQYIAQSEFDAIVNSAIER